MMDQFIICFNLSCLFEKWMRAESAACSNDGKFDDDLATNQGVAEYADLLIDMFPDVDLVPLTGLIRDSRAQFQFLCPVYEEVKSRDPSGLRKRKRGGEGESISCSIITYVTLIPNHQYLTSTSYTHIEGQTNKVRPVVNDQVFIKSSSDDDKKKATIMAWSPTNDMFYVKYDNGTMGPAHLNSISYE